jgi:hypothetical protein
LALSVGLAAILSEDSSAPPAEPSDEPAPRSLFRSRPFWGALAFSALARLPGSVEKNPLLLAHRLERFPEPSVAATLLAVPAALGVLVGYALMARRLSTGTLLRVCLVAQALGFATWLRLGPTGGVDGFGPPIRFAADACLMAGITTLALRAAPRGREALGYGLLLAVSAFVGYGVLLPLVLPLGLGWSGTVILAIAISLLAMGAVSLLPRELTAGRDGVDAATRAGSAGRV